MEATAVERGEVYAYAVQVTGGGSEGLCDGKQVAEGTGLEPA